MGSLRNDLWSVRRFTASDPDRKGTLAWATWSGGRVRWRDQEQKKEKEIMGQWGCGPLRPCLRSVQPSLALQTALSSDSNVNFIFVQLWIFWWIGGLESYLQDCFIGSFILAPKRTHCWHSSWQRSPRIVSRNIPHHKVSLSLSQWCAVLDRLFGRSAKQRQCRAPGSLHDKTY